MNTKPVPISKHREEAMQDSDFYSAGDSEPFRIPDMEEAVLGWYRRFLPHRDESGFLQSISYRLVDSLPQKVLERITLELQEVQPEQMKIERRKRFEDYLDKGYGRCVLRHPEAARCVIDAWIHFERIRYDLVSWVVMPNHVHVLVRLYPGMSLGKIVQSWKSFTGRKIRTIPGVGALGEDGVWMREYWDRIIRDEKHFWAAIDYIENNPVKAGLVHSKEEWPWSSASANRIRDSEFRT